MYHFSRMGRKSSKANRQEKTNARYIRKCHLLYIPVTWPASAAASSAAVAAGTAAASLPAALHTAAAAEPGNMFNSLKLWHTDPIYIYIMQIHMSAL